MTSVRALLLLGCAGCMARTEIKPEHKTPEAKPFYVGDKSCMVHDYENATDVPEGSKNLGWVIVPQVFTEAGKEDDEATYVQARKKICEMGGDGLSQAAWIKDLDDTKPKLKVNAWALP